MTKFLSRLFWTIIIVIIAIVVGMIAPGQWLTTRKDEITTFYNKMIRFPKTPVAQNFLSEPFNLKIVYVENTEGQLETYLVNTQKGEMLPIFEVEGTTQVGDVAHRFRGIGEEGRTKLKEIFENAKDGSSSTLERALQLLGK